MKKSIIHILCLLLFLLYRNDLISQSIGINTDGSAPNSSAQLDIKSSTKGILLPRMTSAQRSAIVNPAKGLLVYDSTVNQFWYFNGSVWGTVSSSGTTGWLLTGNSGTNSATEFIGTTDNQSLRFRVNNIWAGELHSTNRNAFLGINAGKSNTIGTLNAALGSAALSNNTGGSNNVAIGDSTLYAFDGNITLGGNTAVGTHALYSSTSSINNTAIGGYALYRNVDGGYNTSIGINSLSNNISGDSNTAIGTRALQFNTASQNTATGASALRFNSLGANNTANGFESLYSNTSGINNSSFGISSMHENSTGSYNTAVGSYVLHNQTVGRDNVAIGISAMGNSLAASENVAIGNYALFNQYFSNGGFSFISANTAIGFNALANNAPTDIYSGVYNTAIGHQALYSNSTGTNNTAIGKNALFNSIGSFNTGIGVSALNSNLNGGSNVAVGVNASQANTSGTGNTALGLTAMYANTTGNYNTAIGRGALVNLIGGSNNIAIGEGSGTAISSPNVTNTISIGNNDILNAASNQAFIGNLSMGFIGGRVGWSTYSDARIKNNIVEDVKGLEFIMKLKPVTYFISNSAITNITGNKETLDFPGKNDNEKIRYSGFLAQDVEKAAIDAQYNFSGVSKPSNPNQLYTMTYEQFVVPLVKAVQEQQSLIEKQQEQINMLMKRLEILEKK